MGAAHLLSGTSAPPCGQIANMTTMSQYLRAERPDVTEPVSFYAPGAWGWGDPRLKAMRARRSESVDEPLHPVPVAIEEAIEQ